MLFRTMFVTVSIMVILTFLFCMSVYSEGSVGIAYQQNVDDISYGANVTYERNFDLGELEIASQIQSGNKHIADAHASFTFEGGSIGFRPYIDITGKSDTLGSIEDLGGKLDYGLTFNFPFYTNSEMGVGVFLRNANPFAPKVLYELVDNEYVSIDSATGINYDNPAKVNLLVYTGFEPGEFDIGLKGSMGLGERDYWLIADITTAFDLGFFNLNIGLNIGNRWYVNAYGENESRSDIALISAIGKQW